LEALKLQDWTCKSRIHRCGHHGTGH